MNRWWRARKAQPHVDSRFKGAVRRTIVLIGSQLGNLVFAMVVVAIGAVLAALCPVLQQYIVDSAILSHRAPLIPWLVGYLLIGVGVFISKRVCLYRQARAVAELQYEVRNRVHEQLQHLDEAARRGLPTGQLVSRVNSDASVLVRVLANVPQVAGSLMFTAAALVAMVFLSPLLAIVTLLMVPVLTFVASRMRAVVQPSSWDSQQREGELTQAVDEAINGVRVVKAFGQEQRELDRMVDRSQRLYAARMRMTRVSAKYESLLGSIPRFGQVFVLALGGWLALDHRISVGTFLAFASYLMMLVAPARIVAGLVNSAQRAGAAATRIFEVLDSVPQIMDAPDARELTVSGGELVFDNVRAGHAADAPVLDGFSLRIAAGEKVALVGASGSGKSTAALLLVRFRDVLGGAVRIDGQDVREVTLDSLRRQIAVVFEDSFLFTGSVRQNIGYGRPDATDAEVIGAARAAGIHDFIATLPAGYDTEVGERGMRFSGGQRQRIALARALLTGAPVLILDDVTSAVDAKVEREVVRGLLGATVGRTALIVTHRPATLQLADRIAVLDGGRIIATGRHEELLRDCPRYRELLADDTEPAAVPVGSGVAGSPAVDVEPADAGVTASAWAPSSGRAARADTRSASQLAMEAEVAKLPPATDRADIDVERESRYEPGFTLLGFLRPYRAALGLTVPLFILGAVTTVLGPYLYRNGIDNGVRSGSLRVLLLIAGAMGLVSLADLFVIRAMTMVSGELGQRLIVALRLRVWSQLKRLSLDFYERHMAGHIMTRMVTDVESISGLLSSGLSNAVVSVFSFAGVLGVMLLMSPWLTAITALVLIPFVLVTVLFQRLSNKPYADAREQVSEMNAGLQESLAGVRETQAFGQQDRQQARFKSSTRAYVNARMAAQRLASLYFPFVELLSDVAAVLVLAGGAWLISHHHLDIGELIAFMLYLNLFFTPVQQMSTLFDSWQQARVSMKRITEVMAERPTVAAPADPVVPPRLTGALRLRGVGFRYPDGQQALRGIDLDIRAGETLAVLGESGSGKSTLVKLVARFYDPTSGSISVDGIELRSMAESTYRAQLGYVPQEPFLFAASVRDNIAYGRPDATDAQVEAAARAVGAHDMIAELDGGYRFVLDERGASLSAGQRQLLCLARAELVDPAILLLDEATSNLDVATEAAVFEAMRRMSRNRTALIIAHRLAAAEDADRIAVLAGGRLVELGTPAELRAAGGYFAKLHAAAGTPVADPISPVSDQLIATA